MSYQVLARKWRPTAFSELVGQDPVVRILTNSLKDKRLHPALIFAGPRGTGKTSCARILAKTLSCPNIKNESPCNQCKTCEDINNSKSLDIVEIDGASNNGVEAVRDMKETINYSPTGPFKIYIIDEVHMLSISAFNALLKTLEEPPASVIFIMATTELRKIPSTVLSRCQILQFRQIADHLIYEQLKKICKAEKINTQPAALWMLAREAQGSLRDAQGLLDQMRAFCKNSFNSQEASALLGLTDYHLLKACISALLQRDQTKMLQVLEQLHIKGAVAGIFLQNLITELRNLLLLKLSSNNTSIKHLISLSEEEKKELSQAAQNTQPEDIHLLFDMALKGYEEMKYIQDTKIYLEMLLLRMSQAPYIETLLDDATSANANTTQTSAKSTNKNQQDNATPANANTTQTSAKPANKNQQDDAVPANTNTTQTPAKPANKNQQDDAAPANTNTTQTSAKPANKNQQDDIHSHKFIQKVQSTFSADILNTK